MTTAPGIRSLKALLNRLGYTIVSVDHLGVDVELDLARLSAGQAIATVFDVGGNFGQSALRFAAAFPKARVFTFEPVADSYQRLQRAASGNDRIVAFP